MSRAGSRRHRPGWCGTNRRRARLHPTLEDLDDDHAPATARTGWSWIGWFSRFNCRRHREQLPDAGDIGLAAGAGEQAVVSNAVEALRQDVQQEASDELVGAERHRAIALGADAAIILGAEGDAALVE